MNSFQGLEHRNEIFYKKKNITYINDSKATSFEASKTALKSHKNIFWIHSSTYVPHVVHNHSTR